MLGRALRRVAARDFPGLTVVAPSRAELDLTDRAAAATALTARPYDAVIHAGAKVGGIQANIDDPVAFLDDNLAMNSAIIMGAHAAGIDRLVFLGSSCMFPRDYRQPLVEDDILAAPLEPTNEGYALSKITGARLCDYLSQQYGRAYRTIIPCNLFGEDDHFGSVSSHLIAAIISKMLVARATGAETVEIWGSGQARREFLFVDDLAWFILDCLPRMSTLPGCLNVGYGSDHSVNDYYRKVADLIGFSGDFTHDLSRPEGMMRKLMSSARAEALGWVPRTPLDEALLRTIVAADSKLLPQKDR